MRLWLRRTLLRSNKREQMKIVIGLLSNRVVGEISSEGKRVRRNKSIIVVMQPGPQKTLHYVFWLSRNFIREEV